MVREKSAGAVRGAARAGRPSAVVDTRVIYCGDNLDQLKKLPDGSVDLIYIDPPFNSNRNYEVFWGETKEKRAFEDRHVFRSNRRTRSGGRRIEGRRERGDAEKAEGRGEKGEGRREKGDALTEIDGFFRKTGKVIIALRVKEILDEEIAKKLA